MPEALVQVDILGLRDLRGRFARLADVEMREIQLVAAEAAGEDVKRVYQYWAPKSKEQHTGDRERFWQGIESEVWWSGHGFAVAITTQDPQLRRWLAEGTGVYGPVGEPIVPTDHDFLHFWIDGEEIFTQQVAGMEPNDWEVFAALESAPIMLESGNRIGRGVIASLTR